MLVAVGDLQLGDSPTTVGYGFYSRYGGVGIDALFDQTQSAFQGADILFANLETTLAAPRKGEARRGVLQMRGESHFAADLEKVGFSVLNVANNHAVQHGNETFAMTVAAVREQGIACCGVRGQGEWTSEPVMLNVRGTTVGILGYCRRPRQYGDAVPPYAEGSDDAIRADVVRLRATGATVIVSLHWGEEFVTVPSRDEVATGRMIIDAGASLIIGHHPHVTRPVERHGSGIIAYSLGNFMGDMTWYRPFRHGLILRCSLQRNEAVAASVTSTRLGDDYRPRLLPGSDREPLADGQLEGMGAESYARAIADTWRRQRLAAYLYAVRRLPRTPWPILSQLVRDTISNKLSAIGARAPRG
ncbi:MAG TPA: CapA family protein [Gemmatimonadaceae bacterium]|jgi:poly-gamma-glutamate synthesis protein (capsule biosynthesis protein)|nr:CapA family protein [Gemmatimonadaceae bacterium]